MKFNADISQNSSSPDRILFLLSGNISSTPRALKAYETLKHDFLVDIVGISRSSLWDAKDQKLISSGLNNYIPLKGLRRNSPFKWLIVQVLHLLSLIAEAIKKGDMRIISAASSKSTILLLLYLYFNPPKKIYAVYSFSATFYTALEIARKCGAKLYIDIEDFHPGESVSGNSLKEKMRRETLFQSILPVADGITFASPLISMYTNELVPGIPRENIVLNSFPASEFKSIEKKIWQMQEKRIGFIWYSQRISYGRGLEELFEAFNLIERENPALLMKLHFTFVGAVDEDFRLGFLDEQSARNPDLICSKEPMPQSDLHAYLAEFDIGLALEFSSTNLNRDLCLTNKILAYAQSGLYILATDTQAQTQFIEEDPNRGMLCGQTPEDMTEALKYILEHIDEIRGKRKARFEAARSLAWENESKKLLKIWNEILK